VRILAKDTDTLYGTPSGVRTLARAMLDLPVSAAREVRGRRNLGPRRQGETEVNKVCFEYQTAVTSKGVLVGDLG
jgi:hypothetical protein